MIIYLFFLVVVFVLVLLTVSELAVVSLPLLDHGGKTILALVDNDKTLALSGRKERPFGASNLSRLTEEAL